MSICMLNRGFGGGVSCLVWGGVCGGGGGVSCGSCGWGICVGCVRGGGVCREMR